MCKVQIERLPLDCNTLHGSKYFFDDRLSSVGNSAGRPLVPRTSWRSRRSELPPLVDLSPPSDNNPFLTQCSSPNKSSLISNATAIVSSSGRRCYP